MDWVVLLENYSVFRLSLLSAVLPGIVVQYWHDNEMITTIINSKVQSRIVLLQVCEINSDSVIGGMCYTC